MAEVLLSRDSEMIDNLNGNEMSPLHFAAMRGHHQTCRLLLQKGARPNCVTKTTGSTSPLHLAARNGYAECCKVLVSFGADVNACDQHKQIPLHLSAR